jgi:soluble cytochrome b562
LKKRRLRARYIDQADDEREIKKKTDESDMKDYEDGTNALIKRVIMV